MSLSAKEPGVLAMIGGGNATPHFVELGSSASGSIPAGARNWQFWCKTGTATLGGTMNLIANMTVGPMRSTLLTALAYTTGATSTASIYYET